MQEVLELGERLRDAPRRRNDELHAFVGDRAFQGIDVLANLDHLRKDAVLHEQAVRFDAVDR